VLSSAYPSRGFSRARSQKLAFFPTQDCFPVARNDRTLTRHVLVLGGSVPFTTLGPSLMARNPVFTSPGSLVIGYNPLNPFTQFLSRHGASNFFFFFFPLFFLPMNAALPNCPTLAQCLRGGRQWTLCSGRPSSSPPSLSPLRGVRVSNFTAFPPRSRGVSRNVFTRFFWTPALFKIDNLM